MKTVTLKAYTETISINGVDTDVCFLTTSLIKETVNQQPEGGFTVSDMMQRLRILAIIEPFEKEFNIKEYSSFDAIPKEFFEKKINMQLEDQDYELVKNLSKNRKWGIVSRSIIDFVNSL